MHIIIEARKSMTISFGLNCSFKISSSSSNTEGTKTETTPQHAEWLWFKPLTLGLVHSLLSIPLSFTMQSDLSFGLKFIRTYKSGEKITQTLLLILPGSWITIQWEPISGRMKMTENKGPGTAWRIILVYFLVYCSLIRLLWLCGSRPGSLSTFWFCSRDCRKWGVTQNSKYQGNKSRLKYSKAEA